MKKEKNNPGVNRILFAGRYNESEILSGPEKTAKRIFHIHAEKNEMIFLEYFFEGKKYSVFKKLFGCEIVEESTKYQIIRAGIFRLIPIAFRFKPDIIHFITFERFAVILILYKLFRKVKLVFNVHGVIAYEDSEFNNYPLLYRLRNRFAEKLFLKFSDKLLFLNESLVDIAEKYHKFDEKKVFIVPGGVDEIFSSDSPEKDFSQIKIAIYLRDSLKINTDIINILSSYDVSAVYNNNKPYPNFTYFEKMRAEDLKKFFDKVNIFISTSPYEPFSIISAEAMASGLILIAPKQSGIFRFILDGENGFCYDANKPEELKEILEKLSSGKYDLKKISSEAGNIYKILNWKEVYNTYRNIYD